MSFVPLYDNNGMVVSYTQQDNKNVFRYTLDCNPILEYNKARQNDGTDGYGPSRELRFKARVPFTNIYQWLVDDGIEPRRWMRMHAQEKKQWLGKKLNDPDHRYLKAVPGRV